MRYSALGAASFVLLVIAAVSTGTIVSAQALCSDADKIATLDDLRWSMNDANTKDCIVNGILHKAWGSVFAVWSCNDGMNHERYARCKKVAAEFLEKERLTPTEEEKCCP